MRDRIQDICISSSFSDFKQFFEEGNGIYAMKENYFSFAMFCYYVVESNNEMVDVFSKLHFLLDTFYPVNSLMKSGSTPLQVAIASGSPLEIIEMIIEKGADVNKLGRNKETAIGNLGCVIFYQNGKKLKLQKDIFRVLIRNGLRIKDPYKEGSFPFFLEDLLENSKEFLGIIQENECFLSEEQKVDWKIAKLQGLF